MSFFWGRRLAWKVLWVIFSLWTSIYTTEKNASDRFIPSCLRDSALLPLCHMMALRHHLQESRLGKLENMCAPNGGLLLWFSSSPQEWDLSKARWIFFKDGCRSNSKWKSLWVLWIWFSGLILKWGWIRRAREKNIHVQQFKESRTVNYMFKCNLKACLVFHSIPVRLHTHSPWHLFHFLGNIREPQLGLIYKDLMDD